MGDKNYFFDICQNEFLFLKEEFACLNEKKLNSSWGNRFSNNNKTTGVILTLEWREVNIFAQICRLVDGSFVEDPGEIGPDTGLFNFDLEDIVSLRSGEKVPLPTIPRKGHDWIAYLTRRHANNVRNYARDLFLGDFSLFEQLDRSVKKRAKEAAFQKWGEAAVKFGWKR